MNRLIDFLLDLLDLILYDRAEREQAERMGKARREMMDAEITQPTK